MIQGSLYENKHDLKLLANYHDMYSAISDALNDIRSRLKHEFLSDDEELFLIRLKENLWIEGIDL